MRCVRRDHTAERIEQGALEIGRLASGADQRVEGVVRLAVSELSVVFFARLMARLHEAHPDIQLQLVVHPDLQHTARIRAVIEHIMAAMHEGGIGTGRT